MKIIKLEAENIKRLKAVSIEPNGNVVQITGANGSGKSSVLDSIYWALAGTKGITSRPVRAGTEKATIRLDLGEVVVTRRFTEAGGTSLTVEAQNGARFPSPQTMLDGLLGTLSFDPLAFARATPKEQLAMLRTLVPVSVDLDELDRENVRDYAKRTDVNRLVKSLAEEVRTAEARVDPAADLTMIDVDALQRSLSEAENRLRSESEERHVRDMRERRAHDCERAAAEKRAQAEVWMDESRKLQEEARNLRRLNARLDPLPEPTDYTTDAAAKLRAAVEENMKKQTQAAHRKAWRRAVDALEDAKRQSADLTERMAARTRQKEEAIAEANMPVVGLSFGDGMVTFNGIPFDQASDAEQLRVSIACAMAGNPDLRVVRVRDGSLLDEASLALLGQMADENDMQVWIERVDTSGKVGIVMVDGEAHEAESDT